MSDKAGPAVAGAAVVGLLLAGVVSTLGGDVAVYDGASLSQLPARLKTEPVIDSKTLEILVPAGPRHTFGLGGDCGQGSRYCSIIYDASTDSLDLDHCYAVVQLADAEGGAYTECQVTADVWRAMRTPKYK